MRTFVPVPRGGNVPLRASQLFLLCVSLEVFATPTRRYHGWMLIHPSTLRVPLPTIERVLARRFGTLASPPPPVFGLPWGPISLATKFVVRLIPQVNRPFTDFRKFPRSISVKSIVAVMSQMRDATRNLAIATKTRKSFATNFGNKLDPLHS